MTRLGDRPRGLAILGVLLVAVLAPELLVALVQLVEAGAQVVLEHARRHRHLVALDQGVEHLLVHLGGDPALGLLR